MEPPTPTQPEKPLDFLRPAIAGGLFCGALSAIPLLNVGNCLCCLWIQGGGGIAAWLLNKQRPGRLKYGDGALAGVLTGLVGTIVSSIISIPIQMIQFSPANVARMQEQFNELLKLLPDAPPEFAQTMAPFFTPGFSMSRLLMGVISFSIVGGLFAMIGGILMVALLKRQRGGSKTGSDTSIP